MGDFRSPTKIVDRSGNARDFAIENATAEKAVAFTESECARMMASINWLIGFVQGAGREVPEALIERLSPLVKASGMAAFYTPNVGDA
jgi:hypothetical protein